MAESFKPASELNLYCRFCKSTLPAQLERGIAGSGRIVNKESTFEYVCPKCQKSHYFFGKDLITESGGEEEKSSETEEKPRAYKTTECYLIGEKIQHPSYKSVGTIVGKNPGVPNRLLVKFEKTITPLVEGIR